MSILDFFRKPAATESELPATAGSPTRLNGHTIADALARLKSFGFSVKSAIDLGASDGKWTRVFRKHFPDAVVLGVEPLTERRRELENAKHELDPFHFEICAAGRDDNTTASLHTPGELDGSYIGAGGAGSREVPVRTLDSLARQYDLTGPILLKFDTHGYEREILEGAAAILPDVEVIVMEMLNFGGFRFPELLQYLDKSGFRPIDIVDVTRTPTQKVLWQFDCVLVKKEHPLLANATYE
jgi:FkbM family methyltransferase